MSDKYAWEPTQQYITNANVSRLMKRMGAESIAELRQAATKDIAAFWDTVVGDLGIHFSEPYSEVLDTSDGIAWAKWFLGGEVNIADNCVDRHVREGRGDTVAVVAEGEDGAVVTLTYAELQAEVDALANALRANGISKGDAVGVYLPMIAEAVVAFNAIAKIGALYLPIFSGFAPSAVAVRLQDAKAKVLITVDGSYRRGKAVLMKPSADEAVAGCPTVEKVVVFPRLGAGVAMYEGRDVFWHDFIEGHHGPAHTEPTGSEDVFMLAYTSGTTGKPKGAVHVHGGFLVKIAAEVAYQTDLHQGETIYWVTDMGWIMGPWQVVGAGALGATVVLYEGSPDYPDPGRVWQSVAQHNVNVLGVSPTLIRGLKQHGDEHVRRNDLSTLRILASTGEPWNPEPYNWLSSVVGGYRLPIINISGGTEVGACFLSPYPVEPIKECSLGGPSLAMDIDVFDPDGNSATGTVGELVCKQPWPGMTRGIWGDSERYLETYWSMYEGVWRHGDWAMVDEDGDWFLFGRSDDAINVAGKRIGPAEVESILVSHPSVIESAVVGIPHETKGEAIWGFCVVGEGGGDELAQELSGMVADVLGKPFKPSRIVFVDALPKTRSAKIIRRAVRAVAIGEDPGDLSSAENPGSLDSIKLALIH